MDVKGKAIHKLAKQAGIMAKFKNIVESVDVKLITTNSSKLRKSSNSEKKLLKALVVLKRIVGYRLEM